MKNKNFTVGFILIFLGIFWLLDNLNILNFSVWNIFFDLWPVILIIIGLNLIFRKNKIIIIIAWILFIIFAIFYGFYLENSDLDELENQNIVLEKKDFITNGILELKLLAGDFNLKSTKNELLNVYTTDPNVYYESNFNNNSKTAQIEFKYKKNKKIVTKRGYKYKFNIDENIVWDINVDMGAIDGSFDLQSINFQNLDIDAGAGSVDILLGQKLKDSKVDIDMGAGDINITIPRDLGVKIRFDGGVKHSNLKNLNWIHKNNYYISPNYDNADKRIYIAVNIGAGNLNIKYE
ncbi:LiaI-LiaF-like domain-containing protein [Caloranaerobacter sp. DY30410]|uniref:LiaI-LiaF-like domain-containing protein n=1 Tax=Caloranaerobacter sp. DY30410 TaxID=3238305 RepID=UPI003CFD3103